MDKPQFFWKPPDGEPIVAMTIFENVLLIATPTGVYAASDDREALDRICVGHVVFMKVPHG